jgi:phosphopantetheine--protein transferase-like protein
VIPAAARVDPPVAAGDGRIGSARVLWRLIDAPDAARSRISALAHDTLGALVVEHDLFDWRGLERIDARSKPQPVGAPPADVSVAHSSRHILVAACIGARVGVDVESAPFSAFGAPALQRRMSTPAETATAALLDDDERHAYLARVWTAKEAVVKATGAGLATDFRTLVVEAPAHALPQPFEAHVAVLDDRGHAVTRRFTIQETS